MEVNNEVIGGRLGLVKFSSIALSGPVRKEIRFSLNNGAEFLVLLTHKDAYSYDFDTQTFKYWDSGRKIR